MTKEEYPLNCLNVYTHDLDSHATGKGKHSRVIASKDSETGLIGARIDLVHLLRMPSEREIRAVARRDGWKPGRKMVQEGTSRCDYCVSVWVRFE